MSTLDTTFYWSHMPLWCSSVTKPELPDITVDIKFYDSKLFARLGFQF